MVFPKGLLEQKISGICLIAKDFPHAGIVEPIAESCLMPFPVERFHYRLNSQARKVQGKDFLHNSRFVGDDRQNAFNIPISEGCVVPWQSFFKVSSDSPLLIFADGKGLLLCVARENTQHEFSFSAKSVNVLFLKENVNTAGSQLTHGFQQRYCIPCKA